MRAYLQTKFPSTAIKLTELNWTELSEVHQWEQKMCEIK